MQSTDACGRTGVFFLHLADNRSAQASHPVRAGGQWPDCRAAIRTMVAAMVVQLWLGCPVVAGPIRLPAPARTEPITIVADSGRRTWQGQRELWVLEGNCSIAQGPTVTHSDNAVIWINRVAPWQPGPSRVAAYLEGNVTIRSSQSGAAAEMVDRQWAGTFETVAQITLRVKDRPVSEEHAAQSRLPPVYQRAVVYRGQNPELPRALIPAEPIPAPSPLPSAGQGGPIAARRISVYPRSDVPVQFQWERDPATNQWVAIITSGVNLVVSGISGLAAGPVEIDTIDVSTDRLVIWTTGIEEPDLSGNKSQPSDVPLEIYMEGNVVFRQGERVIYAHRMYYDVTNQVGIVLGAEVLTPVPNYEGMLRLRSEILRQLGRDRFLAEQTYITSSRMGVPGYRLEAGQIYFEDIQQPVIDPVTGQPVFAPDTGQPILEHQRLATSTDNWLFLGQLPVFYWPRLATDLTEPSFYVRKLRIKNDSVFGTQVLSDWDAFQLLGIRRRPQGVTWDLSFDYLSDRGFGHGTNVVYRRGDFFGIPGPVSGLFDFWGIEDNGFDNLGLGRRAVQPEKDYRWRLLWQHRQRLPYELQLTTEVGWIGDRNFLEQYYEREWDELKDQTTGVELKQLLGNTSWSISADYRINDFFTQTDWLPRADHFALGIPLLNDALTWYEHTTVGYARFNTAEPPENPAPGFRYLPWETPDGANPLAVSGERVITRQEIDWPFQLGPVKLVGYALGELGHWGSDLTGDDIQRAYGQLGVRASLPLWKVDPLVENELLNLHGLAHKVVFDVEVAYADASRDLSQFPLYDPLDDDAVEVFRRRFPAPLFVPQLDERFYALRTGMAGWVTAPSLEVADDLMAVRFGMRNRWQTKRGDPENRQIIDWLTLDTNAVLYPKELRDNYGRTFGLVDYDLRWFLGNRLTLVSTGAFDFFPNGQQVITIGGFLDRPPKGNLYAGWHLLEGPLSSSVLAFSYSYWMSPKWVSSFGATVDLAGDGNIGQNFSITRIGESLLVSVGVNVDASRNNVGAGIVIEPRFLPRHRLGQAGGAQIPVAGAHGLE